MAASVPVGEGSGTETPSPTGHTTCHVVGCDGGPKLIKGLCQRHYQQRYRYQKKHPPKKTLPPVVVACPEDLEPLVAQAVENDARPIFMLLWRAIAHWHLQAHSEERSA